MRLGSNSEVSWIGSVQVFIVFGIGTFSGRWLFPGDVYSRQCALFGGGFHDEFESDVLAGVFDAGGVCCGRQWVGVCAKCGAGQYVFCQESRQGVGCVDGGQCDGWSSFSGLFQCLVFRASRLVADGDQAIAETLLPRVGYGWTVRVMY